MFGTTAMMLIGIAAHSQSAAPAKPDKPKTAEEQFKNIQVLKGVPADQLIPTMQFISASLGVECDFCHVEHAFEKDDKKPKQVARKMMQMMFAINKDNFDSKREVTCYSCHRGSVRPVATPLVATGEPKPGNAEAGPIESADSSLPAADQLIGKYLQALGGADALKKISSRVQKGKASGFGDDPVDIDIYTQAPEKRVSIMHLPSGDSITGYNGTEGWMGSAGRPTREMGLADLDAAAMDADLQFALHLAQRFSELKSIGEEHVGNRPVYVVQGSREGYPPVKLYFDKETGLLLRLVRYADTAVGLNPTQIDYADYRDAGGVKTPFQWTLARPSGRFTIQVDQTQQNIPIDQQKFVKPAQPPAKKPGN